MSGDAGDTQKQTTKLPAWFEDAAKKALAAGEKTAKIGYVPYMGPDVAAFSPQMVDAMQQSEDWSSAFMRPGEAPKDIASTIMPATDFGGGLRGYSSYPGFIDQIESLKNAYPGMYQYLSSFFIDPVTGKFPGTGTPGLPGTTPTPGTPPPTTTPPPGPGTGGGQPPGTPITDPSPIGRPDGAGPGMWKRNFRTGFWEWVPRVRIAGGQGSNTGGSMGFGQGGMGQGGMGSQTPGGQGPASPGRGFEGGWASHDISMGGTGDDFSHGLY